MCVRKQVKKIIINRQTSSKIQTFSMINPEGGLNTLYNEVFKANSACFTGFPSIRKFSLIWDSSKTL